MHVAPTLRRFRRPLAVICLVAVALAVFGPAVPVLDAIAPPVGYVLLPLLEPLDRVHPAPVRDEQPASLRATLPERAPPA